MLFIVILVMFDFCRFKKFLLFMEMLSELVVCMWLFFIEIEKYNFVFFLCVFCFDIVYFFC